MANASSGRVVLCRFLRLAYRSAASCATHGHRACCACNVTDRCPAMVSLAGMGLLYRGDPDKRSLSHTLAESALVCICCRRADYLVSVAASSWLAPGTTYTAAAEPDLSAGRHADAADAATGSDFPWFQHLLPGRESLCHSPGDVCLRAADPARHAASSAAAGGT